MHFDRTSKSPACPSAGLTASRVFLFLLALGSGLQVSAFNDGQLDDQSPLPPILPPSDPTRIGTEHDASREHKFTLRHVFHRGTYQDPALHKRLDVQPSQISAASKLDALSVTDDEETTVGPFIAKSSSMQIQRLAKRRFDDIEPLLVEARMAGAPVSLAASAWTVDDIAGPNTTDRDTVLNFALMAANTYQETRKESEWEDAHEPFNLSTSFGWRSDGLRGHVFADETNSTVVLAIKGTSPAVFDGAGTTTNDKINDNLFWSCCCGQGGQYLWLKVCDCMTSTYTCNQTCVISALRAKNRYYYSAIELYGNVTQLYPDANVWLAGHSLGGTVSSLLGLTFGLPVITFESPGDALVASRLGLPSPPGAHPNSHQTRELTGAYHFGHTADPIFMGSCNGATSACTLGFYAIESVCHTGHRCVWDTVGDKKWRVSATTHKVRACIRDVYRAYDHLPTCELDTQCQDCAQWNYYFSNESSTTTSPGSSTSTSQSYTRTETCKTPGWWGCLDESTSYSTTVTSTITTTTCKSYGWFGQCLDEVTTTFTETTALPTDSPVQTITTTLSETLTETVTSTSCRSYGWFGRCLDPITTTSTDTTTVLTTTTATVPLPSTSTLTSTGPSTSTCSTPGYVWGCWDKTESAHISMITPPPELDLEL